MPAEGRENPLLKKGNSDAFFREKYLTKNTQISLSDQQRICNDYEEGRRASSVCEINPSIDENNVKSVLRNYRRCWREKLRSLRIQLFPLESLIRSCFSDYSSQFMQIHRQANKLFFYTT